MIISLEKAKKDEIKEVKDGYAKFLISKKLAVPYTETNNYSDSQKNYTL